MERRTESKPGYDCRRECKHEPKREHGIHCDEWWFAVVDGGHALSLTVFSGIYPESVDSSTLYRSTRECAGSAMAWHHADPSGDECEYVEGGRCTGGVTFVHAADFWEAWGHPSAGLEQPETFWSALEAKLWEVVGS